ncbi:MAG: high-affinity branched-chain amino acid ABC transporter permease LivM [Rhodospirillaceae bacterium]
MDAGAAHLPPGRAGKPAGTLYATVADAAIAALIALALALPFVGIYTVPVAGGMELGTRWPDLGVVVVTVFGGRLGLSLARGGRAMPGLALGLGGVAAGLLAPLPGRTLGVLVVAAGGVVALRAVAALVRGRRDPGGPSTGDRVSAALRRAEPLVAPLLLVAALALPFLPFADRRILDLAVLVLTYVMLGWGLNIVVGLAGLLDLGYVAFYAVGAYSFALLAHHLDWGFWACLPVAGMLAALFGMLLGFPVLRLRGDYLAIVTLGFGEIIRIVLINWTSLTNGPNGISGIPRPTLFGLDFGRESASGGTTFHAFFGIDYSPLNRVIFLYYLVLALALVTNFFTLRIRRLPLGRAWEALREDEIACRALGINPTNTKLTAFAIGAMFGGVAGTFFATRQTFVSPESFTFHESAIILAIVVLGGMGSQLGIVLAAILLIGVPEWFRELQDFRMLAFGAAMVAIMVWRPRGLLSRREPTLRLSRSQGAPP